MNTLRDAALQALDALELSTPKPRSTEDDYAERGWREHNAAITALLDALAEPQPQPEPVAPPQRQPLSIEAQSMIGRWVNEDMDQAVANGATAISMPDARIDALVEIVLWLHALAESQPEPEHTRKDGNYKVLYRCEDCGHEQRVFEIVANGRTYAGSGANWCDACGDGLPLRVVETAYDIEGDK